MSIKILNKKDNKTYPVTVNKGNKYANDPFFVKKAEEAEAFIKKHGLPPGSGKKKTA